MGHQSTDSSRAARRVRSSGRLVALVRCVPAATTRPRSYPWSGGVRGGQRRFASMSLARGGPVVGRTLVLPPVTHGTAALRW